MTDQRKINVEQTIGLLSFIELSNLGCFEKDGNRQDFVEKIEFAISTLEKQIPKKPHEDFTGLMWVCSECNNILYKEELPYMFLPKPKYCPCCGQAIDWSKDD